MKKRHERVMKRWSYPTLEEVPRDVTGIYAFWYRRTGRCIYVGKADKQTVEQRLHRHWRRSHNDPLDLWIKAYSNLLDVCYAPVEKQKISRLERRLIRRWKPETNVQLNPRKR